ncbi:MAG: transketolase [Bacteroidales bacterium]|jgi:transketolase|nr:transketolase [Bacteroidales bacterium]MDI9592362.1 transketolase [Bacteroidota bacterium]NLH33966.1 transketolase [Lentimicrobium sp.]MBP7874380.1 transketolase [Bacteroidales bacterium]MCO6468187.1 transketolase [Bacteroidales bacterium]
MKSIFSISELEIKARELRVDVIRSLTSAGSGHLGGSLGLADVFAVLYFHELKHNPAEPLWSERDRLVLSIGHVAPILYAALANSGYFDREELLTLRKLGSRLQGHPGRDHGLPGIELSAGSLGQGLSVAVGMALADKMDKNRRRVYVVLGDGELQEGSVWEAAMSASHYNLDNLIALVDRNRVQIDGRVKNVMEIEPLADKWKAFGWYVIECDGNSIDELIHAFEKARSIVEKPVVILANTLMGKGIPEIENDYRWHGKVPTQAEAVRFINTLLSDGITN